MTTEQASHRAERTRTSPPDRTYGQYCPIAAGLDVLGDRWVLLILRELSIGDRRFTDLRKDLAGIAPEPAVRATALAAERRPRRDGRAAPPAARTVYRLTDGGRAGGPRSALGR